MQRRHDDMSNHPDPSARMLAKVAAWQLGEPHQFVHLQPNAERRHLVLALGEEITLSLPAEKAALLFQAIERNPVMVATVQRWAAEIREERGDPTGAARLRHLQKRQRREAAAAGTRGTSEESQALAMAPHIYPDGASDEGSNPQ
jgi:hypothetical protein